MGNLQRHLGMAKLGHNWVCGVLLYILDCRNSRFDLHAHRRAKSLETETDDLEDVHKKWTVRIDERDPDQP